MRESILTIPVTDIFEPKCGCPICRLRDTLEQRTVEYIMGAAMMEPDVRMETNKLGFCKTHFEQMRACKNRLSLALMLQSHLQDMQKHIFTRKKMFEGKTAKQKKVSAVNNECFVYSLRCLRCMFNSVISEIFLLSRKCFVCRTMTF